MTGSNPSDQELPSVQDIDRLIHEPARLTILIHLYVLKSADYVFLTQQTGLTWGNLSAHLAKLEEAGYIKIEKKFVDRRPYTLVHLTEQGRAAFRAYQRQMKHLFEELDEF
ncbi:MAG: transcriptional regulator [Promethearchaeota archaeon]